MPSTVIQSFDYVPARQELRVTFRSGKCYVYHGVSAETYAAMKAAYAKGEFFNSNVRGRFSFTREESVATAHPRDLHRDER